MSRPGQATGSPIIGLVSHPACALHDTGWSHPEHQGRLPAIVRAIQDDAPALHDRVLQEEAPSAAVEDLLRVHTGPHVELVRRAVDRAAEAGQPLELTADTVVSGASWDAALGAAGAALRATQRVLEGRVPAAFALTRPPGHHATADRPMGFCLFNNVAVAARWARAEAGVGRVLVLDWDLHHGNGTQDIFYDDGDVYYLSLHLAAHYPGTGRADERGAGAGAGTTRNVPFPAGADREGYLEAFQRAVDDSVDAFGPELLLISAGFDCLAGDPLGGLLLEPEDLHAMTRITMAAADRTAAGRVVACLEGGYDPPRVGAGVVQVLRGLARTKSEG